MLGDLILVLSSVQSSVHITVNFNPNYYTELLIYVNSYLTQLLGNS